MHKKLIENIINDFKDFFIDEKFSKFIKYKWLNNMQGGMKVSRTGTKAFIAISNDMKYVDINKDTSKLYILFMISHELAHLVNRHLYNKDKNTFDSKSLEMWADFFGTKIAMSILQDGTRFNQMLTSNFNDPNIGTIEIFKSLILLKNNIYQNTNNSKKYLSSNNRVSTNIAGIATYFTKKEMIRTLKLSKEDHANIGAKWGHAINRKLFDNLT